MRYTEQADRLANLIEERLGIRGQGLEAKLRRAGRLIPKRIRADAGLLVDAARNEANPKLARLLDQASIQAAARNVETWLAGIDPAERRVNRIIGFLSSNALNLMATGTLVIVVLVWRGYV